MYVERESRSGGGRGGGNCRGGNALGSLDWAWEPDGRSGWAPRYECLWACILRVRHSLVIFETRETERRWELFVLIAMRDGRGRRRRPGQKGSYWPGENRWYQSNQPAS